MRFGSLVLVAAGVANSLRTSLDFPLSFFAEVTPSFARDSSPLSRRIFVGLLASRFGSLLCMGTANGKCDLVNEVFTEKVSFANS